jgi:predicted Fe-Mo cluster-binding NifX family protein
MVTEHEHKIAIATPDGKRIDRHLRAAPFFLVYTIKGGRLAATETRVNPYASSATSGEGRAECLKVVDEVLGDVRVLICSGMGENAYVGLLKRDILPLLTEEEEADKALNAYLRGHLKEHPELVHGAEHHDKRVED